MFKTYAEQKKAWGNNRGVRLRFSLAAGAMSLMLALPLAAGPREQAKRIHDRLTGVPPTAAVLDLMEDEIDNGAGPVEAARIAMDRVRNPANSRYFYNVTLKNFAAPWTNEAQSVFEPLNDYTATVIGMIRDEEPFNLLLSADYLYAGAPGLPGVAGVSGSSNQHYLDLEATGVDLSDPAKLQRVAQQSVTGIPASAAAGVMTTRAAARAFFIDGTNRAMFRFTLLNHLCSDLEQVKDTTRSPDRIRQDVSRSPGGDSRIFLNSCVGCHNGMDPMAQAFAYYEYDYLEGNEDAGRLVYTAGQVQPKYHINSDNFKPGYVTPDDRWDNYWRSGPNAILGWDQGLTGSGYGAPSMGQELANSEAFARCQSIKVYRTVCLGEPDQGQLDTLKATFKAGYNMKDVFAEAAWQCMGD
jgi:hypothetical protein